MSSSGRVEQIEFTKNGGRVVKVGQNREVGNTRGGRRSCA